jgi:CubicO group peptidase (beta-lactamase class C family)
MVHLTDKVDELFAIWNKPDSPGCSLAVIKDGEIIYKRGYGMADLERSIPLSTASVFDIGSMGKQFTAMLIAILARQGALSLDDSIRKHFPEMLLYAQPVTIRHLIHHTSGIRDYTTLMYFSGMRFENFYYEEELLDLICRQKGLNFNPGDEFLYSNTNYFLLGVIAKRVTGKSLPALLQEHILDPLGMKATSFNDDAGRIIKNRAVGYSQKEGGYRNDMSFNGGFGDGVILSSVEDLFFWDQNFYHNKLGDGGKELIQEILTPGVLNNGERLDYAFGLWVNEYKGLRRIGHAGGWAGYRSDFIQFPEQKFSVICLANLAGIEPWSLTDQVAGIYLADFVKKGEQLTNKETAEFIVLTPSQIESVNGLYYDQKRGEILKLLAQDGIMAGEGFGLCFPIAATSPTHFQALETPFEIKFKFEEHQPESTLAIQVEIGGGIPREYQKMAITPVNPAQFVDYVGVYQSDELPAFLTILLEGEKLSFRRGFSPSEALQQVTHDFFQAGELHFQFERDENNRVCAFKLRAGRVKAILFNLSSR